MPGNERGEDHRTEKPDPSANPYLVFALCLEAGIHGMEQGMEAPPELVKSIRELSEEEKKEQGIQALPENLSVALFEMEQDPWVEETLGASFLEHYKKGKRKEWKSYMKQVSEWELAQYLYQI